MGAGVSICGLPVPLRTPLTGLKKVQNHPLDGNHISLNHFNLLRRRVPSVLLMHL